ncbi:MAG: hypothetical protein NTW25_12695 [Candidatus Kapabacteria bacterium]|nr:hypothetical protein [Candidatus Kapabacteria bacterium]
MQVVLEVKENKYEDVMLILNDMDDVKVISVKAQTKKEKLIEELKGAKKELDEIISGKSKALTYEELLSEI